MGAEGYFVHQFPLGAWDNFIYLIGCKKTRTCAVVDPAWDAQSILREAEKLDLKITDILCTHSHFDHVDQAEALLEATDAPVHMLNAEIEWSGFKSENLVSHAPGETLTLGDHLDITFVHTPGHTPGSTSYRLKDALLTGDTLFIDGCGRCDFVGGEPEVMYETLKGLMNSLPGGTTLYPGHDYGDLKLATVDEQLASNPYLKLATVQDFVAHRMAGKAKDTPLPPKPQWSPGA
jgi:hydroxyacylglutathione hydrolase